MTRAIKIRAQAMVAIRKMSKPVFVNGLPELEPLPVVVVVVVVLWQLLFWYDDPP